MALKLEKVNFAILVANEPAAMITVGSRRNKPTYAKNGTTPSHERGSRRPPLRGGAAALTPEMPAGVNLWLQTSGRARTPPRRFSARSLDRVAGPSQAAGPPRRAQQDLTTGSWPVCQ